MHVFTLYQMVTERTTSSLWLGEGAQERGLIASADGIYHSPLFGSFPCYCLTQLPDCGTLCQGSLGTKHSLVTAGNKNMIGRTVRKSHLLPLVFWSQRTPSAPSNLNNYSLGLLGCHTDPWPRAAQHRHCYQKGQDGRQHVLTGVGPVLSSLCVPQRQDSHTWSRGMQVCLAVVAGLRKVLVFRSKLLSPA